MTPVRFEEWPTASGHRIGVATLDVPATLNSLSLEMTRLLDERFRAWQADDGIVLAIITATGDKAFCAGGDIQALYASMTDDSAERYRYCREFFEEEYRLDYLLHTFGKPLLCWGHGIVMGGGLGILSACSHRVATETTRIAFPEITIGLFPDAGGTASFSRMPPHLAWFIALTGAQIGGLDGRYVGMVDHVLQHARQAHVFDTAKAAAWSGDSAADGATLTALLADAAGGELPPSRLAGLDADLAAALDLAEAGDAPVQAWRDAIDVMIERHPEHGPWLQRAVGNLDRGCPATARIVIEQIARAQGIGLGASYRLELDVALACAHNPDFREGVRALLIEKDNNPCWRHDTADAVPADYVEAHFVSGFAAGEHPLADLGA